MEVAVLLFDGVSAVEALGPYEVLRRVPGTTFRFVAEDPGPQHAHSPVLTLEATHALHHVDTTGILVVPGGFGCKRLVTHDSLLQWIRAIHETTEWTVAVSTGSVVLAAAGLLDGVEASTHWLARELLAQYGAIPVTDRVAEAGTIITAQGAVAGIEMALRLAGRYAGPETARAIQEAMAFDSDSPLDPDASHSAATTVTGWHRGLTERQTEGNGPKGPWWRRLRRRSPRKIIINPAA